MDNKKVRVIRTSTIALSLNILLKGQLKFLNQYFDLVAVSGSGEDLDNVMEREGVRCVDVKMNRQISLIQDLKSLIALYKLFKKEKPQIVHSITPKAGLLTAIAGKLAGVPIRIHTFTGLIFPYRTGLIQKVLITTDKILCSCATHIFPEGKGVKEDLEKFNITKKPLKILANGNVNGVDLSYFNPDLFTNQSKDTLRQELKIEAEDFVFVFIGRLVKEKGINELVNAFATFKNKPVKLLLVGPFERELDPLEPEVEAQIQSNDAIISIGFQKDVRPYLSIAQALVFPSYREGFPNVVLQAGALKLPSIVSNISGCNEIIIEKENGVIIEPRNVTALIDAMHYFYENQKLINEMGNNAQKNVHEKFDQTLVWNAILNEYKILLKEKNIAIL